MLIGGCSPMLGPLGIPSFKRATYAYPRTLERSPWRAHGLRGRDDSPSDGLRLHTHEAEGKSAGGRGRSHCASFVRSIISSTSGTTMRSQRRFFCWPSFVPLFATGSVSAKPAALPCCRGNAPPLPIRKRSTERARSSDRPQLSLYG